MKKHTCKALAVVRAPRRSLPVTPEVIVLGPGSWQSPYDPEALERAHQKWIECAEKAIALALIVELRYSLFGLTNRQVTNPIWERDSAIKDLQNAGLVYYHYLSFT